MKWIELHTANTVTLINTDHISDIWPDGERCNIWFDTMMENIQQHITVQESYDEVKQLILMDISTYKAKQFCKQYENNT